MVTSWPKLNLWVPTSVGNELRLRLGSGHSRRQGALFQGRYKDALKAQAAADGGFMTGLVFKAILFAALSSPCVAQGCHNGHGGSQNQPPAASPMIAAVPWAAMAAVKRQMSDARSSWSFSERKRSQNSSGISSFFERTDSSLPVVTNCSYSQSNRRPRFSFGADSSSTSGISTPKKAFGKASTMGPSQQTVLRFSNAEGARARLN